MSDKTAIEWTDATWNPLLGCDRVSAGCDGCYAITNARIRESNPNPKVAVPYSGLVEHRDGRIDWTGQINLLPERLDQPIRWAKPRKVFVNSQSDLFHVGVPDQFIAGVFAVMAVTPRHTYQVLTKRPGRMRSLLSSGKFPPLYDLAIRHLMMSGKISEKAAADAPLIEEGPLPNVWLGTSAEDQKWADVRLPLLLDTPAAVRFVSAEPLLGPLDLTQYLSEYVVEPDSPLRPSTNVRPGLDWVIVGGESGRDARPMHPDWPAQIARDCADARVAFLFKQWGEWCPAQERQATHLVQTNGTVVNRSNVLSRSPVSGRMVDLVDRGHPGWARIYRPGKRVAGRRLGDRLHDGYPS